MKIQLLSIAVLALLISCTTNKAEDEMNGIVSLERAKMPEAVVLSNPQEIDMPDMLNPAYFSVVHDSLLFVTNQQNMENFVDVYSLNTKTLLFHLAHRGQGPSEMLSCTVNSHSNTDDNIYLMDSSKKRFYTEDINDVLSAGSFSQGRYFTYSSEVLETLDIIDVSDSSYLAYNMWYLDAEGYQNGMDSGVELFQKNTDSGKGIGDFSNFVASVNGARIFEVPGSDSYWVADIHKDEIRILDRDLTERKRIEGPDGFNISYESSSGNAPVSFVSFSGEKEYRTYTDYFVTKDHVYLIYEGNDHFNMEDLTPVEMFKFDHDGTLQATYRFDRFVNSISISKDERYLYCGSRKSVSEVPCLLRYELR